MKIRAYRASGTVSKVNLALSALPTFNGGAPGGDVAKQRRTACRTNPPRSDLDYLERAFDHASHGEISDEPWLDVTIPSILDSTLADAGHVMSIYVHYTPYRLRSGSWPSMKEAVLKGVLSTLERFAPGIGGLVLAAEVITRSNWKAVLASTGAISSTGNFRWISWQSCGRSSVTAGTRARCGTVHVQRRGRIPAGSCPVQVANWPRTRS